MKIVIDGKDAIVGRLGSYVAKQLLKGYEVSVINSGKTVFSGNPDLISEKIVRLRKMGAGSSLKGPNVSKSPDKLLKRKIRGMLPWDTPRGKNAYKKLRCYVGTGDLKEDELKDVKKMNHKLPTKYTTMEEVIRKI